MTESKKIKIKKKKEKKTTVAYTIVYDYIENILLQNLLIVIQAFSFKSSRYLGN